MVESRQVVGIDEIDAVVERATKARVTIPELVEQAGFNRSTWWRWKAAGSAPLQSFRKVEEKLSKIERAIARRAIP